MTDVFQVLRWELVKNIFADEVEYLRQRRWDFAQYKPDFLVALNADLFSLHHLDQIRHMMDADKAEIEKQEAEKLKKSRIDPSNLTGSHRGY